MTKRVNTVKSLDPLKVTVLPTNLRNVAEVRSGELLGVKCKTGADRAKIVFAGREWSEIAKLPVGTIASFLGTSKDEVEKGKKLAEGGEDLKGRGRKKGVTREEIKQRKSQQVGPVLQDFGFHTWFQEEGFPPFDWSFSDVVFTILVFAVSATTHLLLIGTPASVVFDEVYFGNFTRYYHDQEYFFDIHPPLGKQILYWQSLLSGYKYNETYSTIGSPLDPDQIWRLRMWPALTGALQSPLLYAACRFLSVSPQWALTVGLFVALDQGLLAESRFVLIDAYLSTFAAFCILMSAVVSRSRPKEKIFMALAGIAAGMTVSVKFTGGGVAITLIFSILTAKPWLKGLEYCMVAGISGGAVLLSSFIMHFVMLTKPGPGCIFHIPEWCRAMPRGFFNHLRSTVMLIRQMLASNFAISVSHSYSSKWWQWPFMLGKGTYLWVEGERQLWTIGSPIVWLGGTLSVLLLMIGIFWCKSMRRASWILFGWAISYLPFSLIQRVMWNYHYFIPLMYSLVGGAVFFSTVAPQAVITPVVLIGVAFLCYYVWFPLTYGTPLSTENFHKIMPQVWRY
jgi:dolichyl-phosphate-mannose-protein mannosyltransferase